MCLNCNIVFIAWTELKVELMIRLKRHINVFRYSTTYVGENLKYNLTYLYCTNCIKTNMCHSGIVKHVFYENNVLNSINTLNSGL